MNHHDPAADGQLVPPRLRPSQAKPGPAREEQCPQLLTRIAPDGSLPIRSERSMLYVNKDKA